VSPLLPRLAVASALLLSPALPACGAPSLKTVDRIDAEHLEIVRGNERLAETTLDHLRDLEAVTVSEQGHTQEGVPLSALLDDLKIETSSITAIEAIGADGYRAELDPATARSPDTLIVFAIDGDELPDHKGPLRLLTSDRALSVRDLRRLVIR